MPDPIDAQGETPVRRREFDDFKQSVDANFHAISGKIDQLVQAKQVNWTFVLAAMGLLGAGLGVGIKTLSDTNAHAQELESHSSAIDDFRGRMRGSETAVNALRVEQETQNRWIADVMNLSHSYEEVMRNARCSSCERDKRPANEIRFGERDYWPLGAIGQATIPHSGQ